MNIGIDTIEVADFAGTLKNGGQSFLNRHFSLREQKSLDTITLAGIFAAKEAVFKSGYIKQMDFLAIQIDRKEGFQPKVLDKEGKNIAELKVSISHTNNTVVAVALLLN